MSNERPSVRSVPRSLSTRIACRAALALISGALLSGAWTVAGLWYARVEDRDMHELVERAAVIALTGGMIGIALGSPRMTTVGRLMIAGAMIGPLSLIREHADVRAVIIYGAPLGAAIGFGFGILMRWIRIIGNFSGRAREAKRKRVT